VAIANQRHDTLHSSPDCVAVEMRDLTIQGGHRGLELCLGSEMECVGVPRRQLPRQEGEIFAPLRRGEVQILRLGVGGNRETSEMTNAAMLFDIVTRCPVPLPPV
jgi:hypothetical protein